MQEALVDEGLKGGWDFLLHNRRAIEELQKLDAKLRRNVPVVDDKTLFEFYNELVPDDVCDGRGLRRWLRRTSDPNGERLKLPANFADGVQVDLDPASFPDFLETEAGRLPLRYVNRPGESTDGVTLVVPLGLVSALDGNQLEWGTPGQLLDRIAGLIRLLPKSLRTRLVPAKDIAKQVYDLVVFGEGSFRATIADVLSRLAQAKVRESDLLVDQLPDSLRINIRVEDERGACIVESRELSVVRAKTGTVAERSRFIEHDAWQSAPIDTWQFGDLPRWLEVREGQHAFRAYPGLIDMGDAVCSRLFADLRDAESSTNDAVRRLFALRKQTELREQVVWLPRVADALAELSRCYPTRDFNKEIADLVALRALADLETLPRSRQAFDDIISHGDERIAAAVQDIAKPVASLLNALAEVRQQITSMSGERKHPAVDEAEMQLEGLTPQGFLTTIEWLQLQHFPRYLHALRQRLRRVALGGGAQDIRMGELVKPHSERLAELSSSESGEILRAEVDRYRWMIEEYRVSVFAQELGTAEKVSAKRLDEQWLHCHR